MANKYFVFIAIVLLAILQTSCKQVAKKAFSESAEELTEFGTRKMAKSMASSYGERLVRSSDELLSVIMDKNPVIGKCVSKLKKKSQKNLLEALSSDERFFRSFMTDEHLLEDFNSFVKDAPKLADNTDFLKMYSNSKYFGRDIAKNVGISQKSGVSRIISKSDGSILGEYGDGVYKVSGSLKKNFMTEGELIPNTLYKISDDLGAQFICRTDDLGRVLSIEARSVSPHDLLSCLLGDVNYGKEIRSTISGVRGTKVDMKCNFSHSGSAKEPKFMNVEVTENGRKTLSKSVENSSFGVANRDFVSSVSKKLNLESKVADKLVKEMDDNPSLADLIKSNPDFNIKRWLNTRNKVDKSKIARTSNGALVKNHAYANNTFYFEPALNNNLNSYLSKTGKFSGYSEKEIRELDKLFPNGVPFDHRGFPDFEKAGACVKGSDGTDIKIFMDGGHFSKGERGRKDDFKEAWTKLKKLDPDLYKKVNNGEFTWHHLPDSPARMVLVNTKVHDLVKHSGGVSMGL